MKKFIFNEYKDCINPNRIEIGDEDFFVEIWTACKNGKWHNGFRYWTRGHNFKDEVSLNTTEFESEIDAIRNCVTHLIKSFEWDNSRQIHRTLEIPDYIFTGLRKLLTPQLSLF